METTVDLSDVFEVKYRFYSKNAIAIWTFFLSPLLGCILFAINLKNIGRGRLGVIFVIGGIVWIVSLRTLIGLFLENDLLKLLITNLTASLLLTFFFWTRILGDDTEYKIRPVWKPVLIFVGICVMLLAYNFFGF